MSDKLVNGLPPHLSAEEVPEAEAVWRHQWLYSVVPVGERNFSAYLTGYCRNCGRAFSQRIPTAVHTQYVETQMGIPQTGCVGPE